jgi:fatty acid/phospholipid biosynthesis enzyme
MSEKEKIEKYKENYLNTAKKQIQVKIDKTEQSVSNSQNELSNLKNKEISLNKFINDVREGSNDGTMAALSKKQF